MYHRITDTIIFITFENFKRIVRLIDMETVVYVKNMVCDRCKMAVRAVLNKLELTPTSVELGVVKVEGAIPAEKMSKLRTSLEELGFEVLDDKRLQTIERIKNLIVTLVHYRENNFLLNISDYLSHELNSDYSALSKLFSEFTGITIERYFILQRIERVKELIFYDELSLTQIAIKMNYSSVAYLSSQFKNVTGMTPSEFKSLTKHPLKPIDKV
jgi:AraC family transcriptional regulator